MRHWRPPISRSNAFQNFKDLIILVNVLDIESFFELVILAISAVIYSRLTKTIFGKKDSLKHKSLTCTLNTFVDL